MALEERTSGKRHIWVRSLNTTDLGEYTWIVIWKNKRTENERELLHTNKSPRRPTLNHGMVHTGNGTLQPPGSRVQRRGSLVARSHRHLKRSVSLPLSQAPDLGSARSKATLNLWALNWEAHDNLPYQSSLDKVNLRLPLMSSRHI